jgi:hypothetical protein
MADLPRRIGHWTGAGDLAAAAPRTYSTLAFSPRSGY